ncbi:hypothetical protein [Myxococcus stipitatus]|uniref:hypothetical protein n=1 Tax=Myxococcus stipitatus TaxID=83455 RepID=UPI001E3F68FA|nr:hypothetical protein [Myxococcus stipitatus]
MSLGFALPWRSSTGALAINTSTSPTAPAGWHDILVRHLEPLLGGFTAKMAIHTAALRALKRPPEQVTPQDLPQLLEGLKPMLNTFIGALHAKVILAEITTSLEKAR